MPDIFNDKQKTIIALVVGSFIVLGGNASGIVSSFSDERITRREFAALEMRLRLIREEQVENSTLIKQCMKENDRFHGNSR